MPVTLSIKNVPDEIVERLRARAKAHRRSLQGELLAVVEHVAADAGRPAMTVGELHRWAQRQGFRGTGSAVEDIRRMRDERAAQLGKVTTRAERKRSPRAKSRARR